MPATARGSKRSFAGRPPSDFTGFYIQAAACPLGEGGSRAQAMVARAAPARDVRGEAPEALISPAPNARRDTSWTPPDFSFRNALMRRIFLR